MFFYTTRRSSGSAHNDIRWRRAAAPMAWCGWRDDRAALRVSSRHEKPDAGISNRISMRDGREERGTGKHACACISTTSPAFRASAFRPVSSVRCCAWSLSFPARARATPPRVGLSVSLSSDAALSCLAWASPWDTHACYCGVCTELRRPSPMQVEGPAHWPTASFCSQQATCMAP